MARYIGSVCKRCRRHAAKLYLKGERCYTDKCAMERRPYPPGQHGQGRKKLTGYAIQLRAKQKLREMYGLLEKQFKKYYEQANKKKGITAQNLIEILESRLDNVVYRLGYASSRKQARQIVKHGLFLINGKKVDIPSYMVKLNDEIKINEKYKENVAVKNAIELAKQRGFVEWVNFDSEKLVGKLLRVPTIEELDLPIDLQLIVELYSK